MRQMVIALLAMYVHRDLAIKCLKRYINLRMIYLVNVQLDIYVQKGHLHHSHAHQEHISLYQDKILVCLAPQENIVMNMVCRQLQKNAMPDIYVFLEQNTLTLW